MKEKEKKEKKWINYVLRTDYRLRSDIYCQYQKSSLVRITYIMTTFGERAISAIRVILSLSFIRA